MGLSTWLRRASGYGDGVRVVGPLLEAAEEG